MLRVLSCVLILFSADAFGCADLLGRSVRKLPFLGPAYYAGHFSNAILGPNVFGSVIYYNQNLARWKMKTDQFRTSFQNRLGARRTLGNINLAIRGANAAYGMEKSNTTFGEVTVYRDSAEPLSRNVIGREFTYQTQAGSGRYLYRESLNRVGQKKFQLDQVERSYRTEELVGGKIEVRDFSFSVNHQISRTQGESMVVAFQVGESRVVVVLEVEHQFPFIQKIADFMIEGSNSFKDGHLHAFGLWRILSHLGNQQVFRDPFMYPEGKIPPGGEGTTLKQAIENDPTLTPFLERRGPPVRGRR